MISASKEFKEKLKNGAKLVNYADITLSDGEVLHLTYKDFMIGGCQIEDKTTDGKFGVGFCVGKTLSIRLENKDERFSKYDFYQSIINLYVAMQLDDGSIEKIRKGVFYTVVPETPGDIIEISAVDGMYQLDKDYSASTTAYPATLQRIISDACLDCGIPIGFTQFDNMNFTVHEKPEKVTYRQVMSCACQIAGYNAHIDNNGYMQLIWYNTALLDAYNYNGGNFKTYLHDTVINGGNFTDYSADAIISGGSFSGPYPEHIFRIKSLSVGTDDVQITGVKVTGNEEETSLHGEEGYLIEVNGNPFVNGKEQEVANYLGSRMVGMVFRPFSADVLNNPLYEPFEVVKVSDRKGNVYLSIVNSVSYKIGGYTKISCLADDPVRNGSAYSSPAAQAVVEARRSVDSKISTYDKAVQNMNELAANAMGLFREQERQSDGSYIYYESTKPITVDENGICHFEEGSTVYKKTGDGFFTSTDGGLSYTAGFDSQGNAVVNVLSAIGINADWVNVKDLVAFNATIAGWRINSGQIYKTIDLYPDMSSPGLSNVNDDAPVQYWVWMRSPTNNNTPVFTIAYMKKSDYLSGNDYVTYIFSAKSDGTVTANSLNSKNANITGGSINISGGKLYISSSGYMESVDAKVGPWYFSESTIISDNYTFQITKQPDGTYSIGSKGYARFDEGASFGDNVIVDGDFTATGSKHRLIKTKDFGNVLQSCYETPSPMFGDIGDGKLDDKGICYVYFDPVFLETVSTNLKYQVFLQKNGEGDIWVQEKEEEYFIAKGTPNLSFSWEAKAKQRGYEYDRLEIHDKSKKEMDINYENLSQIYLENYEKELLNYEKNN